MTNQNTPSTTSSQPSRSETPCDFPEPCGHLINTHRGIEGRPGLAYDYILAGNGIHIQSSNRLLTARFPIHKADIHGLPPIAAQLTLTQGLIPATILAQVLEQMRAHTSHEIYCAIRHDEANGYHLFQPPQHATSHSVDYEPVNGAIMDIHSHPRNAARFSETDDQDETGFRLYGVIGPLHPGIPPRIAVRIGIYGHHHTVDWRRVFSHHALTGLTQQPTR